jgi:6-phosphogluconolactonase
MQPAVVVEAMGPLATAAADRFARLAREAISARGRFACALPGGSVAERLFPVLARLDLPWPQVHAFFGDERAVPPDHPDSNVGLARRLWLDAVPAVVHPMPATGDLDAAATAYAADLRATLGDPPRLDLALLGMGPDGHVCSLFPNRPLPGGLVAAVRDSPKPPPVRLTLTINLLAVARAVWVVAFGASKAEVVREAVTQADSALPVARALRAGPPSLLLLDPDAASELLPA